MDPFGLSYLFLLCVSPACGLLYIRTIFFCFSSNTRTSHSDITELDCAQFAFIIQLDCTHMDLVLLPLLMTHQKFWMANILEL